MKNKQKKLSESHNWLPRPALDKHFSVFNENNCLLHRDIHLHLNTDFFTRVIILNYQFLLQLEILYLSPSEILLNTYTAFKKKSLQT
jgi:hypothetical protein